MGLFGKLFEKKECSVCGGEIGLLGNRKLEDGNLCKNCAAKLSPWFSDRRQSTVAEIQEQLAYREANQEKVSAFHPTRILGERTKMLMDDFAKVLRAADQVVLLPIMGGREKDDGSVRSEDLAAKLPGSVVVDGLEGAAAWVRQNAKKGDLVVCMSCGDLYKAADMMVEK